MLNRILDSIEYRTGIKSQVYKRKLLVAYLKCRLKLGFEKKLQINSWQDIPVIINNRNRYTYLLELIKWLERVGVKSIYILDNDSTYPLLLNYYKITKHNVLYLEKNIGKTALWDSKYFKIFSHNYFIYTDPDVLPNNTCPDNAIGFLWKKLKQYEQQAEKVGFGLKIDDLPDYFNLKDDVVNWEKQFWTKDIDDDLYDAAIDTTFAIYRPYAQHNECAGYRTKPPYLLKHQPWYLNYDNLSEEEQYYIKSATISSTIGLLKNKDVEYPSVKVVK